MPAGLKLARIADDVVEIQSDTPAHAQAIAKIVREFDVLEDVVAGLSSVCVSFEPDRAHEVEAWLNSLPPIAQTHWDVSEPVELNVRYGGEFGPDFDQVCASLEVTPADLIRHHTAQVHTVEMIGFTPGFTYISGLPDRLAVPRLSHPRSRVAAGSVGLSGVFTGIYALAGPGGWPLIGRVETQLFDPESETPFSLHPGQRLKFKAI